MSKSYHEKSEFEPVTIEQVYDSLHSGGFKPRWDGAKVRSICPAHDGADGHNLAVSSKSDGGVLIKCHSHDCTYQNVLESLDLWNADMSAGRELAQPRQRATSTDRVNGSISSHWRTEGEFTIYRYQEPSGQDVYENVRKPGKRFGQRRNVNGSFEWNLDGVAQVPYGLHELCKPEYLHLVVHVCEGEKDAIRLRGMGFLAISLADGAITEANLRVLKGRHVVIHEDNDVAGRRKAGRLAEWLHPVASSIRIMRYTDLPEKGDVSDWFDTGGTADLLIKRIAALPDERQIEDLFDWPELEPLDSSNGPDFDPELLPDQLRTLVEAVAANLQVPIDMVVTVALGAISSVTGGQYTLYRWHEPVHGMFVSVARPGLKKSALISLLTSAIVQWQSARQESDRFAIAEWESTERSLTKARDRLEGEPRKGEASGDDRDLQRRAIVQELNDHQGAKPVPTLVFTDDATPQSVGWSLVEQRGRLAIISAEASYLENFTRYSDSPDFNVFLHGHAGDGVSIHRRSGQSASIDSACLTLCLAVQPNVIERMGGVAGFMERGGAARLLMTLPRDNAGYRLTGRDVPALPASLIGWWEQSLRKLLESRAGSTDQTELPMTPEAIAAAEAFEAEIETRYQTLGNDDVMRGWISKQVGASLRIAGLLHLMIEGPSIPLDLPTMQRGIAISEWYREHAEVAFKLMEGSTNDEARAVWVALREFGSPTVNRSDLQQKLRGRKAFKRASDLNAPLATLEDYGYVRIRKVATGERGRPVEWVDVNPAALSQPGSSPRTQGGITRVLPVDPKPQPVDLKPTGTDGFTPRFVEEI